MPIKIIAQQDDIENLIKEIGNGTLKIEGRGYVNPTAGIVGFMIYIKDEPTKIIDVFVHKDKDEQKLIDS